MAPIAEPDVLDRPLIPPDAIAVINGQIADLSAEIADVEGRSASLALPASTGDRAAADEVSRLRVHRADLHERLHTLQQGRAAAEESLRVRADEDAAAEAEAGREEFRKLVRRRIDVAAKLDADAAALQATYNTFVDLGRQAANHPFTTLDTRHGMSAWENAAGASRVLAAMPPMMATLYPQAIHAPQRVKLAETEVTIWRMPD